MRAAIWICFEDESGDAMKQRLKRLFGETLEEKILRHSRLLSRVGVVFSAAVLYGVWFFSTTYFHHEAQEQFEHHASEHLGIIDRRLGRYENTLRGGIGFLQASEKVSREEWHRFVSAIDPKRNNPGMQGIGYTVMLTPCEVDFFEEQVRREGYTSFEVYPIYPRERYSTILYLEPLDERNRVAVGYDMYSEPIRREAMERSADTGNPAASGKVTLLQEIDAEVQSGVLIYLPYYGVQERPQTLKERRDSLIGYVYAPIRMGDFAEAITSHRDILNLEIYDGTELSEENLLYRGENFSSYESQHRYTTTLTVAGRIWSVRYASTPAFDTHYSSGYPILFSIVGLILYLGMLYVIVELLKNRALYKRHAKALHKEKETARNYLEIVDAMVIVLDDQFKIRVINRKGCEVLGYSHREAIGKPFVDLFIPERIRGELLEVGAKIVEKNGCEYYENPIITKGGEERLVAWRNRRLIDEEGNILGILSAGEDITEIRLAQEKLRESEAFYRTLFGSIDEAIVILDNNEVVDCNDLALALFDTTREHFIGCSIFDTAYEIECPDNPFDHYLEKAYGGQSASTRCTLRLLTDPNVIKVVEFLFSPFGSSESEKLVMISRDVTRKNGGGEASHPAWTTGADGRDDLDDRPSVAPAVGDYQRYHLSNASQSTD
jgi:PAS domain S-box-containing protein